MIVPPIYLAAMLPAASRATWRVGDQPPPNVEREPGLIYVEDGELVRHNAPADGLSATAPPRFQPVANIRSGAWGGEHAYVRDLPASTDQAPRLATDLLMLPKWQIASVVAGAPTAVQAQYQAATQAVDAALVAAGNDRDAYLSWPWHPADLALIEFVAPSPARRDWIEALRARIELDFGEATWVLELVHQSTTAPASPPQWTRATLSPTAGPLGTLRAGFNAFALLLKPPRQVLLLVPPSAAPRLREVVDRVVLINTSAQVPWPTLNTRRTPYLYTAATPAVASGPAPYPPGAVRLRPDNSGQLSAEQLSRWARAVTDRRVGVALGGGGSLAYCHLAVLHHLALAGVPIDTVSGVSFGAALAIYWARYGPAGGLTPKVIAHRLWLQLTMLAHMGSGAVSARMVDRSLGRIALEALERPIFPVASDITTGSQAPILRGTAGDALRASGGFAPIFPAAPAGLHAYVDGGLSTNVPARVLQHEGVRLIIASNPVAPPAAAPLGPDLSSLPGPVRGVVDAGLDLVDPRRRVGAAYYGAQTLIHAAGALSASVAQVHFAAESVPTLPFWLMNPATVIAQAASDPSFAHALGLATDRWTDLKAPRG